MINRLTEKGKPAKLPKPCTYCKGLGHLAFGCTKKPRKPLKVTKPMNKRGPVTKKWLATRDKWLEQNKAAYYVCFYCPQVMTRTQLTLDHYLSRGRHPELRYTLSNLVPCCAPCNTRKGSLSGDEYIELLRKETDGTE